MSYKLLGIVVHAGHSLFGSYQQPSIDAAQMSCSTYQPFRRSEDGEALSGYFTVTEIHSLITKTIIMSINKHFCTV